MSALVEESAGAVAAIRATKNAEKQPAVSSPTSKSKALAPVRRQSSRIAARQQTAPSNPAAAPGRKVAAHNRGEDNADVVRFFASKMDRILEELSRLSLDMDHKDAIAVGVKGQPKDTTAEPPVSSSYGSDKTIAFEAGEDSEKRIYEQLFQPSGSAPKQSELRKCLLEAPAIRIPIHRYTFNKLNNHVESTLLESYFSIVEEVGNITPHLTPRVEAALMVNNVSVGTESMQQHVLDAFLMGIIGTAQEYLPMDVSIDRNAAEASMTLPQCRPDYLLMFNGQLVFKGEEKKRGDVRHIAEELTEKMADGVLGKKGKLDYLLGYATAGPRVLFECIHEGNKLLECSDILNLERIPDRVTMLIILINVVRVAYALYNAKK
ncbi:hypothetical protein GGI25_006452 [Coemansia spiralis]|uniref:Uncharacterized protein n=2 Tax=Coemansia TaxID=4863 RepID=A0A9W8G0Y0_9FUNG|nr:hypothetical protein EDC05_006468 [Coemansia umbellata]KAJ2618574.1 hypothetical protein GGI26_006496 [Coemansia sp. RSA 1358]KAJ2668410.1 hypothetical protein GGI25_006452 [Coemansia spiralis]